MKSTSLILCISLALSGAALAQQSTGAQGRAAGETRATVATDRNGANASSEAAGSASASTPHASASLDQGAELNATLSKSVDARSAKAGDEVTATLNEDIESNGKIVVRKGSKLVGHVTTARPLSGKKASAGGDADSQLGLVFDRAVLKDGREVPLNATVQALAATQSRASTGMNDANAGLSGAGRTTGSARSSGGGLVGGVAGGATGAVGGVAGSGSAIVNTTAGASTGALNKSAGAVGGLNATGRFTSGSKGVFGMKGIDLSSATTGNAKGSVLTSSARNVRLDRGTRMLLVRGSGQGNAAIESSKAVSSASGGAAGAANAAGSTNGAAVNTAGNAAGTANVTRTQNGGATSPESSARPTPEPVDRTDKR